MKALLLLAGQSKRFWPLQEKSFFPICGTSLAEFQVKNLREAGIREITLISGGHNTAEVRAVFPDLPCIEQEDLSLGMRGALLSALPSTGAEPVMIVGGNDVVEPAAYRALISESSGKGVDGVLLAKRMPAYFPGGYLKLEGDNITSVIEKPGRGNEPSDLVTIVAHVHNDPSSLLTELLRTSPARDDGYEQALTALLRTKTYHAVPYEGPWYPVKYPWHFLSLSQYMLNGITKPKIHPKAAIHSTAVIEGNVILGEGVRVFAHATIVGPCTIGARSVVGNNALVRSSSVGTDCVIGFATEVKSSVLAHHVWTHMSYIGDSIIGTNVSFGGGSLTGNFRLDEQEISSMVEGEKILTGLIKFGTVVGDGCRIGIRSAINPGIKIGTGTFVSSGCLINQDIPDQSYTSMKAGELQIRPNRVLPPSTAEREQYRRTLLTEP